MLLPAVELVAAIAAPQAVEATAVFAPPLGVPLAYRTERVQESDGTKSRFSAERRIVFAPADDGFHATVTLIDAASDADASGSRFEGAMAALKGVPVKFRLDADGSVIAVGDLDLHWTRFVDALGAEAGSRPLPAAAIAQLRAAPEPQRRAMFVSMLQTVLAPGIAGAGPAAEHAVSISARPPYTSAASATGRYRVARTGDVLTATTSASFPFEAPGVTQATMRLSETMAVDARTGLIRSSEEIRTITLANGARETSMRRATLSPQVS